MDFRFILQALGLGTLVAFVFGALSFDPNRGKTFGILMWLGCISSFASPRELFQQVKISFSLMPSAVVMRLILLTVIMHLIHQIIDGILMAALPKEPSWLHTGTAAGMMFLLPTAIFHWLLERGFLFN